MPPKSRMNTSCALFVSPGSTSVPRDVNATLEPSSEIDSSKLSRLGVVPVDVIDAIWVVPATRSRTKMSVRPFVSGTEVSRLVAVDWNATNRPSPEIAGVKLSLFARVPSLATETRDVVPARRSCTKMWDTPFGSPSTNREE